RGEKWEAVTKDLANLAAAMAPVAGGSKIPFVMSLVQALTFTSRPMRDSPWLVVMPANIAAGTVIMIALNAVVSAMGAPQFETSTQATLSMNDTAVAWPGGPVSSMFQTASVAIKMELPASWALRSPQGAAFMTSVNW